MHFLEWKVCDCDLNFSDVCSEESNWQYPSISLDNGLTPNRRQAIIWTNADPIDWCIHGVVGGDKLTHKQLETYGCILSIVATDALGLKWQIINTRALTKIYSVAPVSYKNIAFIVYNIRKLDQKSK